MRQPPDAPPAPDPAHLLEKLGIGPAGLAEAGRSWLTCAVRLGLDAARRDAIDGDAVAHDLTGKRSGQPNHRAFADSRQQRVVRRAGTPSLTADIDDAAVAPLDHVRQNGLAAAQRVPHVPPDRLLQQLFGEIDETQADQSRRVVDQRVYAAELVEHAADNAICDAGFAEIAG